MTSVMTGGYGLSVIVRPSPAGIIVKGFVEDIEKLTEDSDHFRRVLYTGKHLQLVLMALKPGEEIGEEVHADHDQFFRVEKGKGEVVIDGARTKLSTRTREPRRPGRSGHLPQRGVAALRGRTFLVVLVSAAPMLRLGSPR